MNCGQRLAARTAGFIPLNTTSGLSKQSLMANYGQCDKDNAQQLVQGVDLWLNTPRRPWEACGTSGMKTLVNGGLNISELDGWWAEAYAPHLGWALGGGQEHTEPDWDVTEAKQLYELIEKEIVPEFYERDASGIPSGWVGRIRASMSHLALGFSSNRMLREYVEDVYILAASLLRQRTADRGRLAKEIHAWQTELKQNWGDVRFSDVKTSQTNGRWQYEVTVNFGRLNPSSIKVELYGDPLGNGEPFRIPMIQGERTANGYIYGAEAPGSLPAGYLTPRIVPTYPAINIPLEEPHILWQK